MDDPPASVIRGERRANALLALTFSYTSSAVYELPFAGKLVGGWELSRLFVELRPSAQLEQTLFKLPLEMAVGERIGYSKAAVAVRFQSLTNKPQ